jgi:hypothetical protein
MKKVFKVLLFIVIANFVLTTALITWLSLSSIAPSLKESGVSFSDLFKKDLSPEKKAKLEKAVNENSSELGNVAAKKFIGIIKAFVPNVKIDFSKMPEQPYPYPSADKVLEQSNKAVNEGVAAGMKNLEDAEKSNQAIKEKALADMNK